MSIYRIDEALSTTQKIKLLNDMILELSGSIAQGKFNKNEIDSLYDVLGSGYSRKYLRNVSLGHTLATYVNWSHIYSETGYSIWKITPTNYLYDTTNQLYLDNVLLENRGSADSETATTFDYVFLYNGDSGVGYINNSTEAGTEDGVSFELMDSTEDYLYVGLSTTFAGISFEFADRGSNYTLECEYWNGSVWTSLDISGATYVDDTSNFESDGRIYFTIPNNWALTTVNAQSKYWVRISTSTTPVTTATAYLVIPSNSIISVLKLSSTEILEESWAWASYNSSIYVTVRNAGTSAYEGNYFIKSSSTSINKQNYFIHNHEFTIDYVNSTF